MTMTDPIADYLTRIRNALISKHDRVRMPSSKLKVNLSKILQEQGYIEEWELINCQEHTQFIAFIEQGDRAAAAALMRESHWSFQAYEKFIRRFYFGSEDRIASELAWRKE